MVIVQIVNSVVSKPKIFVKIELAIMSAFVLRDYTKVIIVNQLILFSISWSVSVSLTFYQICNIPYLLECSQLVPVGARTTRHWNKGNVPMYICLSQLHRSLAFASNHRICICNRGTIFNCLQFMNM